MSTTKKINQLDKLKTEKDIMGDSTRILTKDITSIEGDDVNVAVTDTKSVIENITEDSDNHVEKLSFRPPDKYRFHESIAQGGMKAILKFRDKDTARDIAMAVLRDPETGETDKKRFIREAKITANLEHPNIIPIHDIGVDDFASPYFTMKLVKGETLAEILEKLREGNSEYESRYSLTNLLLIFRKVCNAIAFAHSKGIIHLDLTPENILVGNFGEVLVLDWGLAKIIDELDESNDENTTPSPKSPEKKSPELTMDGEIKGTPGYMSPEQAAGRNRERNKKTDIYALGGILYSILTHCSPIDREDIKIVLINTIEGNIIPPKKRAPERVVPSALEAVVMKAMNTNPALRYESVVDLRKDIDAFISGFATDAEKAGLLKKSFLFIKRHKVASISIAVILILMLSFIKYALSEKAKSQRDWITIYDRDFTMPEYTAENLLFMDESNSKKALPWLIDWRGIKMKKHQWLWLENIYLRDNFRINITFTCKQASDALEVCINSKINKLGKWWYMPEGYSFMIGSFNGTKDVISKRTGPQESDILTAVNSNLIIGKPNVLVVQKTGEVLSMQINNSEKIKVVDHFPFLNTELEQIGFRSYSQSLKILSLSVDRLALPEKASPLIAGDSLVEAGHYQDAIKKYLTIAEDYHKSSIAEQALLRAYLTAATKIPDNTEMLETINRKISESFPDFNYRDRILGVDAMVYWRQKHYEKALSLLPGIFAANPDSRIVLRLLQFHKEPLPEEINRKLLEWCGKTTNLNHLNISNLGLSSLEPIKNLRLSELDCSYNQFSDLSPLADMPLEILDLSGCENIEDLAVLENIKSLKELTLPIHLSDISEDQFPSGIKLNVESQKSK